MKAARLADSLAALRDIHAPPDPGWWPPATGFVLLAALVLALAAGWIALRHYRRQREPLYRVRQELENVEQGFARHSDPQRLVAELAELLRRAALARHGRAVAGLSGAAWAAHLAQTAPAGSDPAVWQQVAVQRYAPVARAADPVMLLAQCRRWLEHAFHA
jgi:hypothetical protein